MSGTDGLADAMSLTTFDYDDDGDLDMLVSNTDNMPYLYKNLTIRPDLESKKNWLKVELEGTTSNRDGLGSILKVYTRGKVYQRYHHGAGLLSQNLLPVHFGLGENGMLDSLVISWPNSEQEVFYNIPTNQTVRIIEHEEFIGEMEPPVTGMGKEFSSISDHQIQIYPNPFENSTRFEFEITEPTFIRLEVFDLRGTSIYTLIPSGIVKGRNYIVWKGVDLSGAKLSPSMYIYNLTIGDLIYSGKIFIRR